MERIFGQNYQIFQKGQIQNLGRIVIVKMLQRFYRFIYKNLKKILKSKSQQFEITLMEVFQIYQNEQKREQSEAQSPVNVDDQKQASNKQESSDDKISLSSNTLRRKFRQKLREDKQADLDNEDQDYVEIHLRVAVVSQKVEYTDSMIQLKKKQRKQLRKWMTNHPNQLPFNKSFCKKSSQLQTLSKSQNIEKKKRMKKQRPTLKIRRVNKLKDNQSPIQLISREISSQQSQQQSAHHKNQKNPKQQFEDSGQQKLDFDQFLDRRLSNSSGKIDLGVANLSEVVEHAHSHELLTNQIYFQFVSKYEEKILYEFIYWFKKNTHEGWNFNKYKINLLDHRRISTLLVSLYPDEFVLYEPLSLNEKISEFLSYIYKMNQIEYFNLMDQFDNVHKIKWWKPLQVKYFRIIRSLNPKIIQNSQVIRPQNILTKLYKLNFFPIRKISTQQPSEILDNKERPQKDAPSKRSLKEMLGYDQLQTKSQYKGEQISLEQASRIKKIKK